MQHVPLQHSHSCYCFINNYLITSLYMYIMLQHMENCSINSKWKAWQFFVVVACFVCVPNGFRFECARLMQRDPARAPHWVYWGFFLSFSMITKIWRIATLCMYIFLCCTLCRRSLQLITWYSYNICCSFAVNEYCLVFHFS